MLGAVILTSNFEWRLYILLKNKQLTKLNSKIINVIIPCLLWCVFLQWGCFTVLKLKHISVFICENIVIQFTVKLTETNNCLQQWFLSECSCPNYLFNDQNVFCIIFWLASSKVVALIVSNLLSMYWCKIISVNPLK